MRTFPTLRWRDDQGARDVVLDQLSVLGSSERAHVQLHHPSVSRLHAELEPKDDGVLVRDLDGRGSTFIGGVQVTTARAVDGSVIRLGDVELTVDFGAAETRPVTVWRFGGFGKLVGRTQAMRELFAQLSRLAPTEAPVLVRGETGTGKELVARAIHEASARAHAPFLVVDCAALPETLLEGELYGHAKGAFTGALGARPGVFEAAEGGTVFLDEIGELPLNLQPKLLRVLESKTVRRLGESAHRPVDVRFIAATHRDLLAMVNAKEFREDLYFRLSVLPVHVPPLRERADDIPLLLREMFPKDKAIAVTPKLEETLKALPWRGNVRELRNFVDRASVLGLERALGIYAEEEQRSSYEPAPSSTRDIAPISSSRIPLPSSPDFSIPPSSRGELGSVVDVGELASGAEAQPERALDPAVFDLVYKDFREQWIDHGEREFIRRRLLRHKGNVTALAREAELARAYIYRLIKKHGL